MRRGFANVMLAATAVSLCVVRTQAALTVYTSRSNWQAAIGSFATETFAQTGLGPSLLGPNDYGFFTATLDGNLSEYTGIVEPGAVNGTREFQARISTNSPQDPTQIDVQLDGPVLGIGADFVGTTDGDSLRITIGPDVIEFDQHLPGAGNGFLGVVSTTSFSALTLATETPTLLGESFAIDDVSFGPVLLGDFDGDLDVDGFDFLKWQRGMLPNPLSSSDLANWESNFGFVLPLSAAFTSVPEPETSITMLLALASLQFRRKVVGL